MFNKKMLSLAVGVALMTSISHQTAMAEAGISVGSSPDPVTANVKFKIVVPKVMILSVGDWGGTVNTVTWNYNSSLVATSNTNATSTQWDTANASGSALTADADDNGASNGSLDVAAFGNFGNLKITASTVTDFAEIAAGYAKPSLSEISATASSNLDHSSMNGFSGGSLSLTATNGIVSERDVWSYKYTPSNVPAGGTYNAEVQYTLSSV